MNGYGLAVALIAAAYYYGWRRGLQAAAYERAQRATPEGRWLARD